jgi:hypothetical protein
MGTRGEFQIDPGRLSVSRADGDLEIVVPYTGPRTTAAALERAAALTAGLNAHVLLVAVHTLPYPSEFVCPALVHAHLVEQLIELATHCSIPVQPQVVLARDRAEGFRFALKPSSTVLVATPRRFWRTPEESLARSLARDGHKVALMHIE